MNQQLREKLLTLWDKAVGTKDYSKQEWQEFESLMRKEICTHDFYSDIAEKELDHCQNCDYVKPCPNLV